jgi:hypothetical protein
MVPPVSFTISYYAPGAAKVKRSFSDPRGAVLLYRMNLPVKQKVTVHDHTVTFLIIFSCADKNTGQLIVYVIYILPPSSSW